MFKYKSNSIKANMLIMHNNHFKIMYIPKL